MNTRDLEYLVALSNFKHFGKAANACFVSQPALSMQIKKLEEALGIQLLERTNKSVMLTEHGAIIAERAKLILNQIDELKEIAQSAKDPFSGEIKLGIIPTLAPYLLPMIIPQLKTLYPKISFYLCEEQTSILIEKLKSGQLHAAFLAAPVIEKSFSSKILFEEQFLLAVAIDHPLAKLQTVSQKDLKNDTLLLLEEGHCLRDQALEICHQMDIAENKNFRATSLETLRHMVAAGFGITLIPKLACTTSNTVVYIPFSAPKPMRTIGFFWRGSSAKEHLLKDIAGEIKRATDQ